MGFGKSASLRWLMKGSAQAGGNEGRLTAEEEMVLRNQDVTQGIYTLCPLTSVAKIDECVTEHDGVK